MLACFSEVKQRRRSQEAGGNILGRLALRRHHQQVLLGFCEDDGGAVVPFAVGQQILAYGRKCREQGNKIGGRALIWL